MAYATLENLQARCVNALAQREQEVAEVLLDDASDRIKTTLANNGKSPDDVDAATLERVACDMVMRVMSTHKQSEEYISNTSDVGFMEESWYNFNGQLFMSADDLRDLGITRNPTRAAFASI